LNGYLLDTNVALLSLARPEKISAAARAAIEQGPNVLSAVSYWEVVLKSMKGKLDVGEPRVWWTDALGQLAATPLPLRPDHVSRLGQLAKVATPHADPFDRILIAQALEEDLHLVSADAELGAYAGAGLRVVW
jgi:PIN domain nuclease of toxin-antitoxin system